MCALGATYYPFDPQALTSAIPKKFYVCVLSPSNKYQNGNFNDVRSAPFQVLSHSSIMMLSEIIVIQCADKTLLVAGSTNAAGRCIC
jgi:hypothetical protein